MIQIGSRTKVFVSLEAVDFRKAFRGLSGVTRSLLQQDPMSGHIFVFKNKKGDSVKMICFDGRSSWTMQAKFAQGKLGWWPKVHEIQASELISLISQGSEVQTSPAFRDVSYSKEG